jgi:hypothetical protein
LAAAVAEAAPPKRPIPDYDGRGTPAKTAADVALVPARIVLFPFWFTSEYVLRRPLGALVRTAEEKKWAAAILDLFALDPAQKVHLYPSLLLDFGLLPSAGFYLSWTDAVVPKNDVRLHMATWGPKWLTATLADRIEGRAGELTLRGEYTRRQDLLFAGLGAYSRAQDAVRYGQDLAEVRVSYTRPFVPGPSQGGPAVSRDEDARAVASLFRADLALRHVSFHGGSCCDDPSLGTAIANGTLPPPAGFLGKDAGYTVVGSRLAFDLDSRRERPAPGSGARVEAFAEPWFSTDGTRRAWVKSGASVGVAWDVTRTQRVLSLTAAARGIMRLSGDSVPFSEQVRLGGDDLLPGFLAGRLTGTSGGALTARYTWPVWAFLDGTLHLAAGNIYDGKPSLDATRLSFGVGLRASGARDNGLEVLVAGGTDPFRDGLSPSSLRIVFGTRRGF